MRILRPRKLFTVGRRLWIVDEFQPVAAVLDPNTGELVTMVSWEQAPAPPVGTPWREAPRMLGDHAGLWIHNAYDQPLLRVEESGIVSAHWVPTTLAACAPHGPPQAWCTAPAPGQLIVESADAVPVAHPDLTTLTRYPLSAPPSTFYLAGTVHELRAGADALYVGMQTDTYSLRSLGEGYDVEWDLRWLALPWDGDFDSNLIPADFDVDSAARVPAQVATDDGGTGQFYWHDMAVDAWYRMSEADRRSSGIESPPVEASGLRWFAGRVSDSDEGEAGSAGAAPTTSRPGAEPGEGSPCVVSAHTREGECVQRWDLGRGSVGAVLPIEGGVVVSLYRGVVGQGGPQLPGSVVRLDLASRAIVPLLGPGARHEEIDIRDRCLPLAPRPLEADSYIAQTVSEFSGPDASGEVSAVGEWPETRLQWLVKHPDRPGTLLRRRVPLFDELGRIDPPEYADVHLMAALNIGNFPPASQAVDGVIDI